jgi:hypothetical protein
MSASSMPFEFFHRRFDFLPPRRWRGACCFYPPLVLGAALVVEEAGLDWQKFEG